MNSTGLGGIGIGIGIESPAVGMEQVVGHLHASRPLEAPQWPEAIL